MVAMGNSVLEAQAFSRLLQAKLKEFKPGSAVLEIPIRENLLQQNGFVHGGVISYAADNALTFAGGSVLGPHVLTLEYKINYIRPAVGDVLVAYGTVVSHGKRQSVCRCDVYAIKGDEKTICATAQGTIMTITK